VVDIYQLRGAIEGLAARLAAATEQLERAAGPVDVMREAAGNLDGLLDCDSLYHLELCELSRNAYVMSTLAGYCFHSWPSEDARSCKRASDVRVDKDLEAHHRSSICCARAMAKSQIYVKKAMERFAKTAVRHWEKRIATLRLIFRKVLC